MAMASGSIVEHLDALEDVGGEVAGSVDLLPDPLLLQTAKERLRNDVQRLATPEAAGC